MKRNLLSLLAAVLALALIAAACGSDDAVDSAADTPATSDDAADASTDDASTDDASTDDASTDDASTDEGDTTDGDDAAGGAISRDDAAAQLDSAAAAGATGEDALSFEELEASWADARAAVIAEIEENGWGVEDNILTGPGGWTVDFSECPSDWNNTAGIEDGVLTLGLSIVQSGAGAVAGNIGTGMDAYYNWVNENGGIGPDGLQINLIQKDDGYVATQTQEVVAEMLQTTDPFYITTVGSPMTFAVRETLNDECVPNPWVVTGHQAWGDPANYPYTDGILLSYATEALLWGSYIEANFDEPVKVAALVMDNDFGLAYETSFEAFADESDIIESVQFVRHDPAAATLTNEITTLTGGSPDVFIGMTTNNPCLLMLQEAGRSGLNEIASVRFMPSVCKPVSAYAGPAGDASEGWLIFGGGLKDNTDVQYADEAYISFMNQVIGDAGLDTSVSFTGTGFGLVGWPSIEVLRVAAELDGGLNRANFLLALRTFAGKHPMLLDGIGFSQHGLDDSYWLEGSDLSRFDVATQSWVVQGGIIDLDGQSPNCEWDPADGC